MDMTIKRTMEEREITSAQANRVSTDGYSELLGHISNVLQSARGKVAQSVNTILLDTYWQIGKYIVEYEQQGKARAEYGDKLIERLSKDLTRQYGKGFGRSNLLYIRKFYFTFQKSGTVSHQLSWSHYYEILKLDNPLEMQFYMHQCEAEGWSVRELKREKQSMLFHRLALSSDKPDVLKLAQEGKTTAKPEDILRDPYVLEFVGLPSLPHYKENELEQALIDNLEKFLLELGKGFAFIGRQYKISIAGRHFYVDLVFYHRILKCFVLIDLKRGEIQHEDIGQMNLYLNYFKQEENTEGDNEPIGIVLGSEKDRLMMQYAMQGITNNLFAARYQLYLPNRDELERELQRVLNNMEQD